MKVQVTTKDSNKRGSLWIKSSIYESQHADKNKEGRVIRSSSLPSSLTIKEGTD